MLHYCFFFFVLKHPGSFSHSTQLLELLQMTVNTWLSLVTAESVPLLIHHRNVPTKSFSLKGFCHSTVTQSTFDFVTFQLESIVLRCDTSSRSAFRNLARILSTFQKKKNHPTLHCASQARFSAEKIYFYFASIRCHSKSQISCFALLLQFCHSLYSAVS